MAFPNSSAVSAGDPTEASQYNSLREDALFLGSAEDSAGSVFDLLVNAFGSLRFTRLSATQIRLFATASSPAAVMIGGRAAVVSSHVVVSVDSAVFGSAGELFLFAVRDVSGRGFSVVVRDVDDEEEGTRLVGRFLWTGSGIVAGSLCNAEGLELVRLGVDAGRCDGRLSLVSGDPVPAGDVAEGRVVYFVPFRGDRVSLLVGDVWGLYSFSELSLRLSGLSVGYTYDVFVGVRDDGGGLGLSVVSWGCAGPRPAGSLVFVDGVLVSSGDHGKRYVGSFGAAGSDMTVDSHGARLVWNYSNRVMRELYGYVTSADTACALTTYKVWVPLFLNGPARVQLVVGYGDAEVDLEGVVRPGTMSSAAAFTCVGIGMDPDYVNNSVVNVNLERIYGQNRAEVPVRARLCMRGEMLGFHDYALMGYAKDETGYFRNSTYNDGTQPVRTGLSGWVMG